MNIYPALRYRDALEAIAWLRDTFGFEERMVHPGADREVAHAELALEGGIVMLGSAGEGMTPIDSSFVKEDADFSRLPFTIYVAVADTDAHYKRAVAAGAEIVRELQDTDYGSREYSARDIEGNVWSFGTYHPAADR